MDKTLTWPKHRSTIVIQNVNKDFSSTVYWIQSVSKVAYSSCSISQWLTQSIICYNITPWWWPSISYTDKIVKIICKQATKIIKSDISSIDDLYVKSESELYYFWRNPPTP